MARNLKTLILVFIMALVCAGAPALALADVDTNGYRRTTAVFNSQVSCGTSATLVLNNGSNRTGFMLSNHSGTDIYIGANGVTTANGFLLKSGTTVVYDGANHPYTGVLYCVVSAGTATIHRMYFNW